MSETFMFIASALMVGLVVWFAKSGKYSWRSAAQRGTTALVALWLTSAAMFGISLANTSPNQIVMSNNYNPSGGGWFRFQSDTSRKTKAEGLVASLAIALGIGIVGGILTFSLSGERQPRASHPNPIEELTNWKRLLDGGSISQDEFEKQKRRILLLR